MSKPALILLDLQQGIFDRVKTYPASYMQRIPELTAAARSAGIPVIYVRTYFRQGYPDISPRNKLFSGVAQSGRFTEGDDAALAFPDIVAPQQNDIVVTKRRASAFTGSDLEVVLRSLRIEHLVLCGISTSNAVLSTTRQAADMDYELTVLKDLCLDPQPEMHQFMVENVLPKQARVVDAVEWMGEVGQGA
jgi:nicotinamidase-related amidase